MTTDIRVPCVGTGTAPEPVCLWWRSFLSCAQCAERGITEVWRGVRSAGAVCTGRLALINWSQLSGQLWPRPPRRQAPGISLASSGHHQPWAAEQRRQSIRGTRASEVRGRVLLSYTALHIIIMPVSSLILIILSPVYSNVLCPG